jgi:SAM-dependent methyltransferase
MGRGDRDDRAQARTLGTFGEAGMSRREVSTALARLYDLDLIDVSYDAELYQQLAHQAAGPVLELAVGSGRLAIPLALAGHRVVGIDDDPAMLARARSAWQAARGSLDPLRFTVQEADLFTYRSAQRFAFTFIAVNTFLLAEDDTRRTAVLATMREHLRPGGTAAIEVSTPDDAELRGYDGTLRQEWRRVDPVTGALVTKRLAAHHDGLARTLTLRQVFEWMSPMGIVQRVERTDTLHLVSAVELARLARQVGFGEVEMWGDHLSMPHGPGSQRVILVARLV